MALYRKKVRDVVEAFQLGVENWPVWFIDAQAAGRIIVRAALAQLDGEIALHGDYVLYWPDMDKFGSMEPDEFLKAYEAADGPESGQWPGGG